MKVFKTLITSLFLLLVIAIVGNIVLSTIGLFFNHDIFNTGHYSSQAASFNIKLIFVIKAMALIIFIFGVFVLISKLSFLVRGDFFNPHLIKSFSRSGKLFLVSGIIGFVASVASVLNLTVLKDFSDQFYLNIDSKSLYIMLMILGLFFLLFSKVLSRGNQIQQENDLTI